CLSDIREDTRRCKSPADNLEELTMNQQMNQDFQAALGTLGDPHDLDNDREQVMNDPTARPSRREVLRRSGNFGAALALGAVPLAFTAAARRAFAQSTLPADVVTVLNFALTLEMLEADFYNRGVASGVIPASDLAVFQQIQKHENAHVAFLRATLGSSAIGQLQFDFTAHGALPNPFTNYPTFLTLSQGFEDTGVRAYKGQAPALQPYDDYLTAALRIHSVEARHASEVRRIRGEKGWITGNDPMAPAPIKAVYAGEENTMQLGIDVSRYLGADAATEAFDEPLDKASVLAIASPFIVSQ
ncbi:MAG TPA: ferritin-like domain-containing protein, partial [Gemmatimonadaceae bacterium]